MGKGLRSEESTCQLPMSRGRRRRKSGLPGNIASISWDLGGAIPSSLDTARINLNFTPVPEPGTALLMGLGLVGIGAAGRTRRKESNATA
jgi:hypothetical protein